MKKKKDISICFSKKALLLAWERYNASVGSDAKDYFGISVYSNQLESKLSSLSENLLKGTYKPRVPFKYFEPKKSGTQRTKTVLCIEDALVYQAMANYFGEELYDSLKETGSHVFGSVLNSDVKKGIEVLNEYPEDFYFFEYYVNLYNRFIESINEILETKTVSYILETDITGFFDSIPHSTLLFELQKRGLNTEILELLAICLNVWSGTRDQPTIGVGIPQGPAASFLLANIILDGMDRLAIDGNLHYFRFMDDIRIYGKSKNELESYLVRLDRHLKGKALCLNAKKTSIIKISKKNSEREKLLETSGFEIENNKQEEFDEEILEQDITQLASVQDEAKGSAKDKIFIPIYKLNISHQERELKRLMKKYVKMDSSEFNNSQMREVLTLSQKWRQSAKVLVTISDWQPNQEMVQIWLSIIDKFFWKANNIIWNLQCYESLRNHYTKILKLIDKFEDYEWVQYQLLTILNKSLIDNKNGQEYILKTIPETASPLVRLGYFHVLLDNITSDSHFFEKVAKLIKDEQDDYVKRLILNVIRQKHLNVPIDTLKHWFL